MIADRQRVSWRRYILLAVVVATGLGKLFLVGSDEIVAIPYDSECYAVLASRFHYLAADDYGRPPLFPLFAAFVSLFGLPYRIGIELIYLGACGVAAWGLWRITRSATLGLTGFFLTVVHPATTVDFRYFMSEPLFGALLLGFVGLGLMFLTRPPGWVLGALIGGCAASLCLVRAETPVVACCLFVLIVLQGLRIASFDRAALKAPRALARSMCPLAVFAALLLVASMANYARWGFFALSSRSAGIGRVMSSLYAIKTEDSSQYAPVTRKSLDVAYAVSPTFAQLRDVLGRTEQFHAKLGEGLTGREGEFAAWTDWAIVDACKAVVDSDLRARNAFLVRASREIDAGVRSRRLPRHAVSVFPIDPNYRHWLEAAVKAFPERIRLSVSGSDFRKRPRDDVPCWALGRFDQAANRRTHLVKGAYVPLLEQREAVLQWLSAHYGHTVVVALVLCVLAIGLGVTQEVPGSGRWPGGYLLALVFVLAVLVVRVGFYTVIEASAFPGQDRYLTLQAPTAVLVALLFAAVVGRRIGRCFGRSVERQGVA